MTSPRFISLGDGNEVLQVALAPGDEILANERAFIYRGLGLLSEPANIGCIGPIGRAIGWIGFKSDRVVKYVNEGIGPSYLGLAAPLPGKVIPVHVEKSGTLLVKLPLFLCSETSNNIAATKVNLNPGGPFPQHHIEMRRIAGVGMCYIQGGGAAVQKSLGQWEHMLVEFGCIAAVSESCKIVAEDRTGLKREPPYAQGFTVKITGPGSVYIQSTHMGRLSRVRAAAQRASGGGDLMKAAALTLVVMIAVFSLLDWEDV